MTSRSSRAAGETVAAAAGRRSADGATGDALERGTIVSLEGTKGDVLKSGAEQCDDIDPAGSLAVPEQLAHQPLCTVPRHRPSKASGRDDPQAVQVKAVRPCNERQMAATGPLTLPLHSQELRAPPNPFTARQGPIHQPAKRRTRRRTTKQLADGLRDGQPLPPLRSPLLEDLPTGPGLHPGAETVGPSATSVVRLVRAFHRALILSTRTGHDS